MATKKLTQNEKIRRAFMKGLTRGQLAKRFGVRYQTVFKATSPKYASADWRERLEQHQAAIVEASTEAETVEA